jgi:hypothetical protein
LKRCRTCKGEKPRTAFSRCWSASDGLAYQCKKCDADYGRANAERLREYQARYRAEVKAGLRRPRRRTKVQPLA